jgi:poly-gamma-glutamate synthesis protein (capsule biosynthesis protein)
VRRLRTDRAVRRRTTAVAVALVLALAACSGASRAAGPERAEHGAEASITLAFAGDVHFEGNSRAALSGGLEPITPALSRADLSVVNLETAVTDRGTREPTKAFAFRAPPSAFSALRRAGVDVVTMANNHALDYGQEGLADSLAAARRAELPVVGAGTDADAAYAPYVARVKGRRVAVIGATQVLDANLAAAWTAGPGKPGLASAKDEDRLVAAVRAARSAADVVVVDLHWGTELVACPTPRQRALAVKLAQSGADVVVGSHAHILLGGGWLGRTYVDYGLGNFVFYARTPQTQQSGVLTLTVRGRHVVGSAWAPARIRSGVPRPLSGTAAERARTSWAGLRDCTGLAGTP